MTGRVDRSDVASAELIAIRESIRPGSAWGRALVSMLLLFAQMEQAATGERTHEGHAAAMKAQLLHSDDVVNF